MRSALAYIPRPRPLQLASPGAAVTYLGAFVVVAFLYFGSSPLVLIAAAGGVSLAGVLAAAGRAVRAAWRLGLALALLMAAINFLADQRGETVLARLGHWPLLGRVDVTAEAGAEGLVLGLLVLATVVAGAVYSACVDPDRVLRALRPLTRRSALTATLVSRLVPVATADAERLQETGRLRGPAAAPVGWAALARRLFAGSLDRSVDVAATLELRGYSLSGSWRAPRRWLGALQRPRWLDERRRARRRSDRSRFDRRFYVVGVGMLAAGVAARLLGGAEFHPYPTTRLGFEPANVVLAVLLLLAGLAPAQRRRSHRREVSRA